MYFSTKVVYGCGCEVFDGESSPPFRLVDDTGVSLLCGPFNLPLLEVRRGDPCYRLGCPQQEPFEPWVCCNCEHGPNIESFQCMFKIWKEPVTTPEPDFFSPCCHLRCDKCVSLAELEAAIEERAQARKKEQEAASKAKGKAKAVPKVAPKAAPKKKVTRK